MEHKEKEVVIDIENSNSNGNKEPSSDSNWGKKSLNKLVSGILSLSSSSDDDTSLESDGGSLEENPTETTKLLADNKGPAVPAKKENEKESRKGGKVNNKAAKPPRPPKGPTLDATDIRLLKEISRIAAKKRERMERLKALKKMKAARRSSLSGSSSGSSSVWSSAATISAMFVTVFFFLVLILQGLSSGTNLVITGAPQPAPATTGLLPARFFKNVRLNNGAGPRLLPPKCVLRIDAQLCLLTVTKFFNLGNADLLDSFLAVE